MAAKVNCSPRKIKSNKGCNINRPLTSLRQSVSNDSRKEAPMHHMNPADELAEVRAEIARLKLREAQLRARLIEMPPEARQGRWSRAEVLESRMRIFDARLLPPALRDDPRYWRERVSLTLRCLPIQARSPARPGWPITRDPSPRP